MTGIALGGRFFYSLNVGIQPTKPAQLARVGCNDGLGRTVGTNEALVAVRNAFSDLSDSMQKT